MISGRGRISSYHKSLLDDLCDILDFERPKVMQIALAKGIAEGLNEGSSTGTETKEKWEFQWEIIRSTNLLLYKHLIIQQQGQSFSNEDIKKYLQSYLERGIEILNDIKNERTSIDDFRFLIL